LELNNIFRHFDKKIITRLLLIRINELQIASQNTDNTPVIPSCGSTHAFKGCHLVSDAGEDLHLYDDMPALVNLEATVSADFPAQPSNEDLSS
jgi:hypothetical protein